MNVLHGESSLVHSTLDLSPLETRQVRVLNVGIIEFVIVTGGVGRVTDVVGSSIYVRIS